MTLKGAAHRAAMAGERLFDRVWQGAGTPPVLDAYCGYATPDHLILRGRVLTSLRRTEPDPAHSKWVNLRQMASLFLTDEVQWVGVRTVDGRATTRSDEEGYLHFEAPRDDLSPGWHHVSVTIEGAGFEPVDFPVMVPDPAARFGVISDIDDTMMQTGAYSLLRNLWTTFTGSALTREVFADSVEMMTRFVTEAAAPVYYVSSSPWNLHAFLDRVFARVGLPKGPMFLRDLGIGESQFVTGTHGDHKGSAIDRVLAANPGLSFVLVGDTGQHDAHIYRDAIARHGGRIRAVVLRQPGPGPNASAAKAMAEIEATGVPLLSDTGFEGFAARVLAI